MRSYAAGPVSVGSDPQRPVGAMMGQKVRVSGTWCDATDASGVIQGTTIQPITGIVVDRSRNTGSRRRFDFDISPDRASGQVIIRNILGTLLS